MSDTFELVREVVSEIGKEHGYEGLVNPTAETPVFGGDSGIDSLTLVRIVAELERAAEAKFGRNVVLADERAMSRRNSPFRTVGTLSEFLAERLKS